MDNLRDEEAIHAVLAGDIDRYAELVDRHQDLALRLAYQMLGNAEDAKDASQEAFVSAYRSLKRFRSGSSFSTWFYRIVVNTCKDVYRRQARRPRTVASVGDNALSNGTSWFVDAKDPSDDPSRQLANQELGRRLTGAIGALPMKQRTAFVLHHLHGLKLEEVAAVMRCRVGTVKTHIFRANDQLRQQLGPWLAQEGV